MLSRRRFLGGLAAVAAAPLVLPRLAGTAQADTPSTLAVDLVNSAGGTAYVTITGFDPGSGAPLFVQSDGHTVYYPSSPSSTGAPLAQDCAIAVGGRSSVTVPRMVGGRVYFSLGTPLHFALNPGNPYPGVVAPSAANPNDPNAALQWGFCELTYDASQLFGNISFVDFVGLPIALHLDAPEGSQDVGGLPSGGLASVCDQLRQQAAADGAPWDRLIVNDAGGQPLRVLSPNLAGAGMFGSYLDDYAAACWQKYAGTDLSIDTQYTWGVVTGRVSDGQLTFPGVGSFSQPSTAAIFSCSQAPFTTANDEMGNLSARLAAALNRTTLLDSATQPAAGGYYGQAHTNHYSRILHATEAGGLGYAFPYDDVHASGGADVEGKVQSGDPGTLTITVGAPH